VNPTTAQKPGVSIVATSVRYPRGIVDNETLGAEIGLQPKVIERLTGIQKRPHLAAGETLQDLAADACEEAILSSGLDPSNLDLMIFYTDVPTTMPENGRTLRRYYDVGAHLQHLLRQRGLEVGGQSFNIAGSCVSFLLALEVACGMVRTRARQGVLIVGATNNSFFLKDADVNTVMTFSDATAATVLAATEKPGFLGFWGRTDGRGFDAGYYEDYRTLWIDRKRVAEYAPRAMQLAWHGLLQSSGLSPGEIDLVIPHQAGLRIVEKGLELAGIPQEKVFLCLRDHGNSGATAIQAALGEAGRQGRLQDGAVIALLGFGTGWHCGAAVFRHHSRPLPAVGSFR